MTKASEKRARRAVKVAEVRAASRGGRPSEYDPAFCDVVIRCGAEGKSRAQIAAELEVSRNTVHEWSQAHPEFADALQRAKDLELAWWEEVARKGVNKGSQVNATLWGRAVSGRFPTEPYRERTEVSGPNGGPIETRPLTDELAALPKDKRDAIRAAVKQALEK